MSEFVLDVRSLCKCYGNTVAVDQISFHVRAGEIVALLGPNGAGKTTTINMILGVLQPTAGSIHIGGMDLARRRSETLALTNFSAVYAPLPGNLTVDENLRVFGMLYDVPHLSARIDTLLERFHLREFRNTRCGVLSSGEQTRVALAKALLNQPKLLLLDEPTASLDPATAQELRGKIRELATDDGTAVLWTSHNMFEVEAVCDRVLMLARHRILLEGDPKTLPQMHGKDSLEELFISIAREPMPSESK